MKLVIFYSDGEYRFDSPTVEEIAAGNYYTVPLDMYEKFLEAQDMWDMIQADAEQWVRDHPNEALEPEVQEGGLESMYPEKNLKL